MTTDFKERMAKVRAAKAAKQSTGVIDPATEFLALNQGRMVTDQQAVPDEASGLTGGASVQPGTIVHKRPAGVTMYKPDGRGGYTPRNNIPASAIGMNLANGWFVHCPECGGDHDTMDPNECPAHEPIATAFCPICPKQIWDNRLPPTPVDHSDNPNVVRLEFNNSTPQTRLKATMDVHIWMKHPQQARILGLDPLVQSAETAMDISGV